MPKMKTKRCAAKRFRATGGGGFRRYKGSKSHLLTHKNRKRKRRLRQPDMVDATKMKQARTMMPYA